MNSFRTSEAWAVLGLYLFFSPQILAAADPKIIEAGRRRANFFWWSTIAQEQAQKLVNEFMKLYPFIKANHWRSGSVGLHNKKILCEARAGCSI